MLTALSIRDVVLIEALDLDFGFGLGVLTGETGAGKSILLDALGLALGGRGDSGLVRHGAAQAVVTATFEPPVPGSRLATILDDAGVEIEPGEPLFVRRLVKADGGSRGFVNDQPAGMIPASRAAHQRRGRCSVVHPVTTPPTPRRFRRQSAAHHPRPGHPPHKGPDPEPPTDLGTKRPR